MVVIFIAHDGFKVLVIKKHLLCDEPHTSLLGVYVLYLSQLLQSVQTTFNV